VRLTDTKSDRPFGISQDYVRPVLRGYCTFVQPC